ncbi:helix-turn-helix domain-containing protein [Streptococcus suis]|nr:helix-turn-helix domain-containing protein [Streptococcus suis]
MKSNLGKTLRKIRKGKQFSLDAVADQHLSKSQISRFERGESEISCARLINILDKLHLSLEEFMTLHDSEYRQEQSFYHLMHYIREEYVAQQVSSLKNLLTTPSDFQIGTFETTMIKSIIATMDTTVQPTEDELAELTDYLFGVEIWGHYEVILLANCVRTIKYQTFFLLTKEMIGNYVYVSTNKTNKRLVTQLALNCLIQSIDEGKPENCQFLIDDITKLLENELNFYEQTVFLYAQGYFAYKQGSEKGRASMEEAILVFELLGEQSLKAHYLEHFEKNVRKS